MTGPQHALVAFAASFAFVNGITTAIATDRVSSGVLQGVLIALTVASIFVAFICTVLTFAGTP